VEADDRSAVAEMPTRAPLSNPTSVAAIAALASSIPQESPMGFDFLTPDLESGVPISSSVEAATDQGYSPPPWQRPTVTYSLLPPPVSMGNPPPPTRRPPSPVASASQAERNRIRELTCENCRASGEVAPDWTCAACRSAVFRFSYNQSASEQSTGARGEVRPISYAEGGSGAFVHELSSN